MSVWSLPIPASVLDVPVADGVSIAVRRHGNPSGPRIILSHGCGMAADTYFPFWSLLLDRFDLMLFDFRSHGWNPVSDRGAHNIPTFVSDYAAILRAVAKRFGEKPAAGVFHSLAALTALLHAQAHSGFAGLVLFDPPVCPPGKRPRRGGTDRTANGRRYAAAQGAGSSPARNTWRQWPRSRPSGNCVPVSQRSWRRRCSAPLTTGRATR